MIDRSNRFWKFANVGLPAFVAIDNVDKVINWTGPILESPDLPFAVAFTGWLLYAVAQLYQSFAGARWTGDAANPSSTFVAKKSLIVGVTGWIFGVAWLSGGVLMLMQTDRSTFTLAMAFCLVITGVLSCLALSVAPSFKLTLSRDGFEYSACGMGEVVWTDVSDSRIKEIMGRPYGVEIGLCNADAYLARSKHSGLGRLIFLRRMKAGRFIIATDDLGIAPEDLKEAIDVRRLESTFA